MSIPGMENFDVLTSQGETTVDPPATEKARTHFCRGSRASSRQALGFWRRPRTSRFHSHRKRAARIASSENVKIAYVIVNYDDNLHECGDLYENQIAQFSANNPIPDLEVEFDIKPAFYTATGV
jgi:hypothetical protein